MNGLRAFFAHHPRLASWLVLAVGMVAILLWAAPKDTLSVPQLGWLVVACIALAGGCAWIIGWE